MNRLMLALPLAVVACGGGGGGGGSSGAIAPPLSDGFNPEGDVVDACDSPYYREIEGKYGGQIEYEANHPGDGGEFCRWETSIEITTGYTTDVRYQRFCDLTATMTAEPLEGGTPTCSGMDRTGDMTDALRANTPDAWISPPWPVDATIFFASALNGQSAVYPAGRNLDRISGIKWVFDGLGNATLPTEGIEWTGTLVKE